MVFPDEATWARLGEGARERVIDAILGALDEYREAMSESVRHFRRKVGVVAELDAHFRRAGRRVFIAGELAVFYPNEPLIVPDVLAVRDCDPDLELGSWVVQDQKRGIDLVIEVRHLGKKHKDLVDCVRDYARRKIPEYFAFDCQSLQLRGWRLPHPEATSYQPIMPQGGMLRSTVLELDLCVVDTRLRFFANQAMVPDAQELVARLQRVADEQQGALDDTTRRLDDTTRKLDDTIDRLASAQVALASGILALCAARGVALTDAQRALIAAETDVARLSRWMTRAAAEPEAERILA